jgi:hypothetical protein
MRCTLKAFNTFDSCGLQLLRIGEKIRACGLGRLVDLPCKVLLLQVHSHDVPLHVSKGIKSLAAGAASVVCLLYQSGSIFAYQTLKGIAWEAAA